MKPRLLILSDLWGDRDLEWIRYYVQCLECFYDITLIDCCTLGEIENSDQNEEEIHAQFINGGVDRAVNRLQQQVSSDVYILAFSIGGTIAWRASLGCFNIKAIFAISSTRLRYEIFRPSCYICLVYGELDKFIPSNEWLAKLKAEHHILKDEGHTMYRKQSIALYICNLATRYLLTL